MSRLLAGFACLLCLMAATVVVADDELPVISPEVVDLGRPVDFQTDIVPMMDNNCVACHNVAIAESRLSLESVEEMLKGGRRGAAIVPGKPDESLLYQVAAHAKKPVMPPLPNEVEAASLTPRELGILRKWIEEGASAGSGSGGPQITWQSVPGSLNSIYAVALSPWDRFAASARANQIDVYDLAAGHHVARLNDPTLAELQIEGRPLYPSGAAHRDFVHSLAFSPDGNWLASGGYRVVKLWQRNVPVADWPITGTGAVTATAQSLDGRLGAVAGDAGVIVVFPMDAGNAEAAAGALKSWTVEGAAVTGLALPSTAEQVIVVRDDSMLQILNRADGTVLRSRTLPAKPLAVIAIDEGEKLAVACEDGVIRVWPTAALLTEGEELPAAEKELKGHGGPVLSLALQPGANGVLVSGGQDGTLRIWNLGNGQQVRSNGHGAPVSAAAVRADGLAFVSVGANNLAKLWDQNGKHLADLKTDASAARAVVVATENETVAKQEEALADTAVKNAEKEVTDRQESLDKSKKAVEDAQKAKTEADDKLAKAMEATAAAAKELEEKPEDEAAKKKKTEADAAVTKAQEEATKAQATLDSAQRSVTLAEASLKRVTENRDGAKTAHAEAVKRREESTAALKVVQEAVGPAALPVNAAQFVDEGRLVAVSGAGGRLAFFAAGDGKPVEVREQAPDSVISSLLTGADGRLFCVAANGTVQATTATAEWRLAGWLGPPADDSTDLSSSPFVDRVLSLAFSPDGKFLATGGGEPSRSGELLLWDLEKREVAVEFVEAHSDTVFGIEFSRDGKRLLSGAADKFAKAFDVATGKYIRSFEGHTSHVLDVSWKADGSQIVTSGADNAIKVWNTETGEQSRTISSHSKQVPSLQYLSTGEEIVSVGGDATVRMHKTSNGQNYRNLGGATDFVYAVAASRDGKLVIAGGEDGTLRVWNSENAQVLHTFAPPAPADNSTAQVGSP